MLMIRPHWMSATPGPILEGEGMCMVFQKKGKKGQNIGQNVKQKCLNL